MVPVGNLHLDICSGVGSVGGVDSGLRIISNSFYFVKLNIHRRRVNGYFFLSLWFFNFFDFFNRILIDSFAMAPDFLPHPVLFFGLKDFFEDHFSPLC